MSLCDNCIHIGVCEFISNGGSDEVENCRHYEEERPHGEWIKHFDGNEWFWYCTSCKEQWYEEDLYMGGNEFPNFCPCCGADMRDKKDDLAEIIEVAQSIKEGDGE